MLNIINNKNCKTIIFVFGRMLLLEGRYLQKVAVVMLLFSPRPNKSLLFTSSMLWSDDCKNMEEYYNKCVGVPLPLLPTVLGLKLAVDLELGSRYARVKFSSVFSLTILYVMGDAVRPYS